MVAALTWQPAHRICWETILSFPFWEGLAYFQGICFALVLGRVYIYDICFFIFCVYFYANFGDIGGDFICNISFQHSKRLAHRRFRVEIPLDTTNQATTAFCVSWNLRKHVSGTSQFLHLALSLDMASQVTSGNTCHDPSTWCSYTLAPSKGCQLNPSGMVNWHLLKKPFSRTIEMPRERTPYDHTRTLSPFAKFSNLATRSCKSK